MIIRFNCEVDEIGLIPFHIWMNAVPFNTKKPLYYVAILGDMDNIKIEEFCDENPEQCLIEIRSYLSRFHYIPQDVVVTDLLEPNDEFAGLIANFKG